MRRPPDTGPSEATTCGRPSSTERARNVEIERDAAELERDRAELEERDPLPEPD
jgi:hypothetical protein